MGELSIPARWGVVVSDLAEKQGWDAAEILMSAHVSPRLLNGEPAPMSRQQLRAVVRIVLARTKDESYGLSGTPIPRGTTKLMLFSLATSSTVSAAHGRLTAFRHAIPFVPTTTVTRSDDLATLTVDVSTLRLPDHAVTEWLLALMVRGMSWLTMRQIRVVRVLLPHPRPSGHMNYNKLLGAPAEFDCASAALVIHSDHLDAPILRSEEEITTIHDRLDELVLGTLDFTERLPDRVRRIVQTGIGQRVPTVGEIATALSMAPSALQRTLRTQFGTSVRELRDVELRDAAIKSLEGGTESLTNLSGRLGFSEVSAFNRAFRRWTGASPAQYRDSARSVKQLD